MCVLYLDSLDAVDLGLPLGFDPLAGRETAAVVLPIGCPEESDRISGVRYSMEGYEDSRSLL